VTRTGFHLAVALIASCLAVRAAAHGGSQGPAAPDVQKLGPQIGQRVPDFTLTDQQGRSRSLASLMGPKGLMLVFFRSADW